MSKSQILIGLGIFILVIAVGSYFWKMKKDKDAADKAAADKAAADKAAADKGTTKPFVDIKNSTSVPKTQLSTTAPVE